MFVPNRGNRGRTKGASIPDFEVSKFVGLITAVKDPKSLPEGAAADSLNWLTGSEEDHIELRGGTKLLGLTRNVGNGKITGLKVAVRQDGTQIPFFSYLRKIKYYNAGTDDTVEVGSNLLPVLASGEDVAMDIYSNLAGAFLYASSPHSSIYKIHTANPANAVDQNSASFKGLIKIKNNRMILWNSLVTASGAWDKTSTILSYIDKSTLSQYTLITGESVGTGDGATKTFAGTLTGRSGVRTVFNILISDTVENFTDDKNGLLVGSLGGTGTINYATGAYSVTFNTAPNNMQGITAQYNWEDSTSAGICDFSYSTPRTAGQGDYFPQFDGGGSMMNIFSIGQDLYCLHVLKTWVLTLTGNDTSATNFIYRSKVGIPYPYAADETGDGIPYLDYSDKNNPVVRILTLNQLASAVVPDAWSEKLDLSGYGFDFPVLREWSNFDVLCCQNITNGVKDPANDVMFIRNRRSKNWDKLDYPASRLEEYGGNLIAGDPISNNVFVLFSGADDDGSIIPNYWNSRLENLKVKGLKKFYKFIIDGYINPSQMVKILFSFDNGQFVSPSTSLTINGSDPQVDLGSGILVGANTVGSQIVGATSPNAANAFHFRKEITVASDIFEFVQVQLQALGVGALQVNSYRFSDIRYKGRKVAQRYYTQ